VSVYLPGKESWYNLRNGLSYAGGVTHKLEVLEDSIPSFQRAGTIVPRKDRFRRSSTQMVNDPYTLVSSFYASAASFSATVYLWCSLQLPLHECSILVLMFW